MKRVSPLVLLAFAAFAQTPPAVPARSVYVLSMPGGMDQFLASALAREHVAHVVTDAAIADTFLTDTLGAGFERRLEEIRPPREKADKEQQARPVFHSNYPKGTIFLVDAKSRQVIWSDYQKAPKNRSASAMNRAADRIAKKLRESFAR